MRARRRRCAFGAVVVAAVLWPLASAAAPAKPTVTWTAKALPAGAAIPVAGLVRSSSSGARSWKVTGSCSLRSVTLTVGPQGTCSVTVTIAGTSRATTVTSTMRFPITPAVTTSTTSTTTTIAARTAGHSEARLATPDGRSRTYTLYVPRTLPLGRSVPLLVVLHGRSGWGANIESISGFDALADQYGFVAVYPDGYTPPGPRNQSWNGGYCCPPATTAHVDDVTFIRELIRALLSPQGIDPTRVYVAGYSNGAILAYRLGCELSDVVTAIGAQSGSLGVDSCTPSRPVPFLHIHGTADQRSPIDGGVSPSIPGGIDQRSALSSVQTYATAIGATSGPSTVVRPSNPDVATSTWIGRSPFAVMEYMVVTGATHAWMGHPQAPSQDAIVGKPYDKLDSSAEIWSFVSRFRR